MRPDSEQFEITGCYQGVSLICRLVSSKVGVRLFLTPQPPDHVTGEQGAEGETAEPPATAGTSRPLRPHWYRTTAQPSARSQSGLDA